MCAESVSDFVGVRLPVVGSVAVRSAESCFSTTILFIRNNTEITHINLQRRNLTNNR